MTKPKHEALANTRNGHHPELAVADQGIGHRINAKDLAWVILPFFAGVILVVRAGRVDPGISLSTTPISLLVALAGVAVAVAVPYIEASRSFKWGGKIIAIVASLMLVLAAVKWPWPFFDDNIDVYLGRGEEVEIGVHESLPGWMVNPYDASSRSGFDGKLINFLEREYGFKSKIVRLSQSQRLAALEEGGEGPHVDLVIDVFSMTKARMDRIDMAGPYYVDRALAYRNASFPQPPKPGIGQKQTVKACTVNDTTGSSILKSHGAELDNHDYDLDVTSLDTLNDCLNKFKLGQFSLTVTDWSILRPFEPAMPLMELSGKPIENNDPGLGPYSKATVLQDLDNPIQLYGIGLRKGHPNVCKDLTRKLTKFVSEQWEDAFKDLNDSGVTVAGSGEVGDVTPNWHRPELKDLDISCGGDQQPPSSD